MSQQNQAGQIGKVDAVGMAEEMQKSRNNALKVGAKIFSRQIDYSRVTDAMGHEIDKKTGLETGREYWMDPDTGERGVGGPYLK